MKLVNQLFEEAKFEPLRPDELKQAASILKSTDDTTAQRRCLYILGTSGDPAYEGLIASYLDERQDLTVPSEAIKALVKGLGRPAAYLDNIKNVLSQTYDDEPGLRGFQLATLQVAGRAYRVVPDRELLRSIVSFTHHASEGFQDSAYGSLIEALTDDLDRMTPKEQYEFDTLQNRPRLLKQAEEIINKA